MRRLQLLLMCFVALAVQAKAQLVLSGTSYMQDFDGLVGGLPTGWSVSTSATLSGLGTATTFTSTATDWNTGSGSNAFRNISAPISSGSQSISTDRALGWRPLNAGSRNGAITLTLANTTGFQNFSMSFSLFTGNDVANNQSYAVEYRLGNSGNFTQIGSTYTTGATFNVASYSFNSVTLSALNDQSAPVYIRIRGTTASGTTALDTIGLDDFSLSYAATTAVPEPSTYAAIAGCTVLAYAAWQRRRQKLALSGGQ